MGKFYIDKLDLSKKKKEQESAPLQQVSVSYHNPNSNPALSEDVPAVQADDSVWGRTVDQNLVRQVAIQSEQPARQRKIVSTTRARNSSTKKSGKKSGKRVVRASVSRVVEAPKSDILTRSFSDRIKPIVSQYNEAPDSADYEKKSDIASLAEHTAKAFFNKISDKTLNRREAEKAPAVVQTDAPRVEVVAPAVLPKAAFDRQLLSSGLRVITAPIAGTKTITALLMYGTGSKYESLSNSGISHFLEHMFFKGTKDRPNTQKISSELDAMGSEYNAFTSKEYTGYWIKVDSSKIAPALDVLSDMLLNSKFSLAEIEKEKGVIIEEINMYHENPMMYVEDVFEACLYGDTPAGREIAGPKVNVKSFKRQVFIDYFNMQYGANTAVLCLAGDIDEKTEKLAEKYFGKMPKVAFKDKLRTAEAQQVPQIKIHYKEGAQAIISLGVRGYDIYHKDKIVQKVLSIILGGSMSSRMFSEVREKRGLAYFVHTSSESYTDTGYLTTGAGIQVGKQDEAINIILQEYKKISKTLVSKEELKRAKDLIKGRTIIGFEASDNVADWYARQAILREDILTPEEYFAKLDLVTAEDIRRVAKDIFKNEKLNLAIIGPFKGEESFVKAVNFGK